MNFENSNILLNLFFIELTCLYTWWSYSDIAVYVDPKDLEYLKHEYALNLVNHRYEIDWLVGMVAAQKLGLLGVDSSFFCYFFEIYFSIRVQK